MGEAHWTQSLFVDNAALFLPFLERLKERAEAEAVIISETLSDLGVAQGGKVLDVACGVGRHALPLAKRGYSVLGCDISELYVGIASREAAGTGTNARFVVADVRDLRRAVASEGPFDAFLNMFTSFGYYGETEDLRLLQDLHAMASPDAVLILEAMNRDFLLAHFEPESMEEAANIQLHQRRRLDPQTSWMEANWRFCEKRPLARKLRLELEVRHRVYGFNDLSDLLAQAGWADARGFSVGKGSEAPVRLTPDSLRMWVVARAGRNR